MSKNRAQYTEHEGMSTGGSGSPYAEVRGKVLQFKAELVQTPTVELLEPPAVRLSVEPKPVAVRVFPQPILSLPL